MFLYKDSYKWAFYNYLLTNENHPFRTYKLVSKLLINLL